METADRKAKLLAEHAQLSDDLAQAVIHLAEQRAGEHQVRIQALMASHADSASAREQDAKVAAGPYAAGAISLEGTVRALEVRLTHIRLLLEHME